MDPFFSGGCNLRLFQGIHPLFLCNFNFYEEGEGTPPLLLAEKIGGLVVTGPTGTNVNDVAVALLRAE